MRFTAFLILVILAAFTGTALAAEAVTVADPSIFDAGKAVFDAVVKGQWWAAAACAVVFLMAVARKYMPASWKTGIKGDMIGVGSTFMMAFAGAVATWAIAQPAGAAMSAAVVLTALKVGAVAIGGYTAIHKVAGWLAAWGKLPPWALVIIRALAAVVGSNAIAKAEAAGAKAVAAEPPKGMSGGDKIIEIE